MHMNFRNQMGKTCYMGMTISFPKTGLLEEVSQMWHMQVGALSVGLHACNEL